MERIDPEGSVNRSDGCGFAVCGVATYSTMYWLNRERWGKDAARDARMRMHYNREGVLSEIQLFMLWHSVEVHSMKFEDRPRFHVSKPQWWDLLETRGLNIMSPPEFAYMGSRILKGDPKAGGLWVIAVSGFAVGTFWGWIGNCQHGCSMFDHRVPDDGFDWYEGDRRPYSRMFYLRSKMLELIRRLGVQNLVEGSDVPWRVAEYVLAKMEAFHWDFTREFKWIACDWQTNLFWGEKLPKPVAYRSLDDPRKPSWKRPRYDDQGGAWEKQVYGARSRAGTPNAVRATAEVVDEGYEVIAAGGPAVGASGQVGRGGYLPDGSRDPYYSVPKRSGDAGPSEQREIAGSAKMEGPTVTVSEFKEFQKEAVRFGFKKPNNLAESLKVGRDVMAKASMYGWLTRSLKQYQASLEDQLGLLGVQSRMFLELHIGAAEGAAVAGAGRPDAVEAEAVREKATEPGTRDRILQRLGEPGVTVEELEKLTTELVRGWRSRVTTPIAYPIEVPETVEAGAGSNAEKPRADAGESAAASADPEPRTESGNDRETPAGSS